MTAFKLYDNLLPEEINIALVYAMHIITLSNGYNLSSDTDSQVFLSKPLEFEVLISKTQLAFKNPLYFTLLDF
jgi:hypothetical protein